jgi:coproporphyrinogen III oxidase
VSDLTYTKVNENKIMLKAKPTREEVLSDKICKAINRIEEKLQLEKTSWEDGENDAK